MNEDLKLSEKELEVLKATYFNDFQDCDFGRARIDNPIWPISFSDVKRRGIITSARELSGICSSLQKKGMYETNGHTGKDNATSWITTKGYNALLTYDVDLFTECRDY